MAKNERAYVLPDGWPTDMASQVAAEQVKKYSEDQERDESGRFAGGGGGGEAGGGDARERAVSEQKEIASARLKEVQGAADKIAEQRVAFFTATAEKDQGAADKAFGELIETAREGPGCRRQGVR